jgi:microcin C transport system substrate-binding protein
MTKQRLAAALTLLLAPTLLVACGYQGDPEKFAEANAKEFREATADMQAVAESLREVSAQLERASAAMEDLSARLASADVSVSGGAVAAGPGAAGGGARGATPTATAFEDMPLVRYALDPSVGDPSVPAELGGPGFTGEGWTTNLEFPALGEAHAVKGGSMSLAMPDWPATLRQMGKDWNQSFNYWVNELCMVNLLMVHPTTLEYVPEVATHWWISEDRQTYRFRLNPAARWSDGREITADDVVASFRIRLDPTLLDPSAEMTYGKLEEPRALSKYMLEVRCKEENWRNFLYFAASLSIFPADTVSSGGSAYLDTYQFAYPPVAGPYEVRPADIVTGQSITISRRSDWWDAANPAWRGIYNIDRFRWVVVMDQNLTFEKVKAGEIDFWIIPKAEWYAKTLPPEDVVQRGLLVRHKIYSDTPVGTAGLAINTTVPGLDDVRVRRALQLLHPREQLIDELYYGEYEPLASYWQGGLYQNPANQLLSFDPAEANRLLDEAGWTETGNDGIRTKGGRRLSFTVTYRTALSERSLTVYQERCRDAGIELVLSLVNSATAFQNLREKKYELSSTAWGALVFPNPETSWHSRLAPLTDNNNVTAFADPRVDALCEEYDRCYDVQRRIEIVREIDGLIYPQHPYVLEHFLPCQRMVFWNKFEQPRFGAWRFVDNEDVVFSWWVDPAKEAELAAARASGGRMTPPPEKNRWWQQWNARSNSR